MAISLIKKMDKETVLRVLLTMLEISVHSQKRGEGFASGLFLRYAHETVMLSRTCPNEVKNIINKAFIAMKERRFDDTTKYTVLAYHLVQRFDGGRAPLPIDDYDLSEGGVYFPGNQDEEVTENKFQSTLDSILKEAEECNDKTGGKYRGFSISPKLKRIDKKSKISGHEWTENEQIRGFTVYGPKTLPNTEFNTVKKAKEYIDWFIKFKLNEALLEADYMDNNNPNNNASDQGTITPPDMDAQTQEVPDEKNPEDKPADEEEEPEETEEEPEEKSEVRLLIIDKIPCNRELKELTKDPMAEFPLSEVEAALDKINIAIEPGEKEGLTFVGADGNVDLELIEKSSGKFINNSFLIVYWSTIEGSTNFNFNCYLG